MADGNHAVALTQEEVDTIRERLKNWIEDNKSTSARLARLAHVEQKHVYNWLGYIQQRLKPNQLERLVLAAGLTLDEAIKPLGPADYPNRKQGGLRG